MTPTIDATTRRLVDFALAYRFEDLPASTVHAAKARLLDSAAVGLAAYAAPPVRILRKCAPAARARALAVGRTAPVHLSDALGRAVDVERLQPETSSDRMRSVHAVPNLGSVRK